MDPFTIKFKTIQYINGTKYMTQEQVDRLCFLMCHNLGIEKCEDNFVHIREACVTYFNAQNNLQIK